MQTLTFQNDSNLLYRPLISKYQNVSRSSGSLLAVRDAVKAWEKTIPGKAQDIISQAVASEWIKRGGRGLLLAGSVHNTKQNFFRMVNNSGPKNDKNLLQIASVIADVMPIEIARQFGLKHGMTEAELVANAMKECSEAHQAKLLGAPIQRLEKEVREAAEALLRLLPVEALGPVLSGLAELAPSLM